MPVPCLAQGRLTSISLGLPLESIGALRMARSFACPQVAPAYVPEALVTLGIRPGLLACWWAEVELPLNGSRPAF